MGAATQTYVSLLSPRTILHSTQPRAGGGSALAIPAMLLRAFAAERGLAPLDWLLFSTAWETCPATTGHLARQCGMARQTVAAS